MPLTLGLEATLHKSWGSHSWLSEWASGPPNSNESPAVSKNVFPMTCDGLSTLQPKRPPKGRLGHRGRTRIANQDCPPHNLMRNGAIDKVSGIEIEA